MNSEERRGIGFVALAVLLFSTSPVLIRWAAGSLTSFEIAAGRLLVAALLVGGLALARKERLPVRSEWGRFAFYGLVTALHFGLYIAALEYTTIAHALALVYTAPIFVAIFSWLVLKENLTLRKWIGIGVAVAGVAVLAGFEPTLTPRMLIGDGLAVGSALCFGIYSVAGRSQRERFSLIAYAGTVYTAGAIWLLPVAAANFSPGGYSWPAILSVVALGALPLGLGHTLYNAALRRVSATVVNLVATQEVTGGIVLGMLMLHEMPTVASLIGALVTLVGIVLVVL